MAEAPACRRHDLVRVVPAAWDDLLRARPDLHGSDLLAGWAEAGHPLIVRRYHPGEARDAVPLGLPLPPSAGKRRIGLALPVAVLAPCPAPELAAVTEVAPAAWRGALADLLRLGERFGLRPRPFGGLLWQALTGLPYLSDASDLDLLWPVSGPVPPGFLAGLSALAETAPMRLDGEIVFPDGAGVQWRELLPGTGEAILKSLDRLELRRVDALLATVSEERAA